ncbi:MAG: autotransporter-associated beta strand repeat-containing protein [Betaproteobacteria bacterium]|nr:autotransporter-associated beta strand repeat-containing protein [Betaproteobacteria bacterium]
MSFANFFTGERRASSGFRAFPLAACLALLITAPASAQTTWVAGNTGSWNNSGNWDTGVIPTSADDVSIGEGYAWIRNGETAQGNGVTVDGTTNPTLEISGSGSELDVGDQLILGAAVGSTGTLTLINSGTVGSSSALILGFVGGSAGTLNVGNGSGTAAGLVNAPAVSVGDGDGEVFFSHNATASSKYYFSSNGASSGTAVPLYGNLSVENDNGYTVLPGANDYEGSTTVNGGTLEVSGSLGLGDYLGVIDIANNAAMVFNLSSDQILEGGIIGAGTLTKTGVSASELSLSGDNSSFTGALVVQAGTLSLQGFEPIGAGSLWLTADSIFDYRNADAYNISSLSLPILSVRGPGTAAQAPATILPNPVYPTALSGLLDFSLTNATTDGSVLMDIGGDADVSGATIEIAVESGSTLQAGDEITLIDASGHTWTLTASPAPTVTSMTAGYSFEIVDRGPDRLVVKVSGVPNPPGPTPTQPGPSPTQAPWPTFADGDTLPPGSHVVAPAGNPSFCLGGSDGDPVIVVIDKVPYTITPRAENTCFEIFTAGTGRALIIDSGIGDISTPMHGAMLLEARNGDLVKNEGYATIRASVDPNCTSTRVSLLEGKIEAPDWITAPMPSSGCPEDALTPGQGKFMVNDGRLACHPSALTIKGTWAKLRVQQTQDLKGGQQLFAVAGHPIYGWYQNNGQGWRSLDDPFLPMALTSESGPTTITPVDKLDVRPIAGTELYTGNGTSAEEMMANRRYCGAFRVAP